MAIANFTIGIPTANPVKFTLDGSPKDERQRFDQQAFDEAVHASTQKDKFEQPWEHADPMRIQFYSNYPAVKLEIIKDSTGQVLSTLNPAIIVSYRNKKYRSACRFASINGKLFIYFEEGPEYSDEDFLVAGDVISLDGRLPPISAKAGDAVRYQIEGGSFANTQIASLAWSPLLQAHGYLTSSDYTIIDSVPGLVEITYDLKVNDLYSQLLDLSAYTGCHRLKLSFGINPSAYTRSFTTEVIDIQAKHKNSLAIEYRHNGTYMKEDRWNYLYLSDWINIIRMPAEFFKFEPAGEVDVYVGDNGIPDMLRAMPFRQMIFTGIHLPGWMVDKLNVVFSHDTKRINGATWVNENFGADDRIDRTDKGVFNITLRQKDDRTMFENEFTDEVTASFDPPSHLGLAFGGTVVSSVFHSNTSSIFRFIEVPAWIEVNVDEFQDGDTVEFTILANAVLFERVASLTAITDDFDNLSAVVSFQQLYDTSTPPPPDSIVVSDEDVDLDWPSTSEVVVMVTASGPYTLSTSGPTTFVAVQESGGIQIRITPPSQNTTGLDRTGVVRLTLDSNPAVFVDIDVTQAFRPNLMIGTIPNFKTINSSGEDFTIQVSAQPGTEWQPTSSTTWVTFSSALRVGTVMDFAIHAWAKPEFEPYRLGSITFYNTANPSDTATFNFEQL